MQSRRHHCLPLQLSRWIAVYEQATLVGYTEATSSLDDASASSKSNDVIICWYQQQQQQPQQLEWYGRRESAVRAGLMPIRWIR